MTQLLDGGGQQFGFYGVRCGADGPLSTEHEPWILDVGFLGGAAKESAGPRDRLCTLPATHIAERYFFGRPEGC